MDEIAEGHIVLESEWALLLYNLVNSDVGVYAKELSVSRRYRIRVDKRTEVGLDLSEGHDGPIGASTTEWCVMIDCIM